MLEISGRSMRSGRAAAAAAGNAAPSPSSQQQQPQKQQKHHQHHHHSLRSLLAVASSAAAGQGGDPARVTACLREHLAPRLLGGLQGLLAAIRFMVEDHGLTVGVGELKDLLLSLGCHPCSGEDAAAIHAAVFGASGGAALRANQNTDMAAGVRITAHAAAALGLPAPATATSAATAAHDPRDSARSSHRHASTTFTRHGGHAIEALHALCGEIATRHVQKAVVRGETRQHKHMLSLPTSELLSRLRLKLQARLTPGAGLLDAFRCFHHGKGQAITFDEFRTTIRGDFGLAVPERRLRRLFATFDPKGTGEITFGEFVQHVWGSDGRGEGGEESGRGGGRRVAFRADPTKVLLRKTMAKAQAAYDRSSVQLKGGYNLDTVKNGMLREKLMQHINGAGDGGALLRAFREFHHGHGMSIDRVEFRDTLRDHLGIKLPRDPEDYDELFDSFDTSHSGSISFAEFRDWAMPKDGDFGDPDRVRRRESVGARRRREALAKSENDHAYLADDVALLPVFKRTLLSHLESGANDIARAFVKLKLLGEGQSTSQRVTEMTGVGLVDFLAAVERLGIRVPQNRAEDLFFQIAGGRTGGNGGRRDRNLTGITLEAFRGALFGGERAGGGTLGIVGLGSSSPGAAGKRSGAAVDGPTTSTKLKRLERLRDNTDVRAMLREKLEDRVKGGANAMLEAFRSFHTGHKLEISREKFGQVVSDLLEIRLPPREVAILFNKVDTDGNGCVCFRCVRVCVCVCFPEGGSRH